MPAEQQNPNQGNKQDYVYMKSDEGWQMEHNGRKIMVVVGNFAAYHNGTVITADSAVRYSERHIECFGKVLINRGTTYIYGDRAEYNGETNTAKVYSKIIKVVDGDATLYTYNFSFNTKRNVGHYTGGGVLISGENMLESDRGYLYTEKDEVVCVDRVQMRNEDYDMTGDSVVYNTETNFAQFFTRTNIWNKTAEGEDDYLYADRGSFDKETQLYKLTKNGYILTKDQELLCDSLDYYREKEYVLLRRNVQIDDRSQKMMIFSDWGEYWKEPGNVFVTKNPSLISYDTSQSDSVFIRSDSMYLYTRYPIREQVEKARKDSLEQAAKKMAAEKTAKGKGGKADKKSDKKAEKREEVGEAEGVNALREEAQRGQEQAKMEKPQAQQGDAGVQRDSVAGQQAATDTGVAATTEATQTAKSSKAELRRALIDSLASDTTARGKRLRAKLLKEEAKETNRAIKATMKAQKREQEAKRKVVLAERKALFTKLLGEAKVRDAERRRIEKAEARRVKDSLKRVAKLAPDSVKVDSVKRDSIKVDSIKVDTAKVASRVDSVKVDSVKIDTLKADTLKADSVKVDTLAKFDTMTVKQVRAYFKAIADKEKAELERIEQDSLDAKLDRIGRARQAKRAEQYRKWAIRDSIYLAKEQERSDMRLRRKLARMAKRGIFIHMADSATLAKVDSTLLAEFGPLEVLVNKDLDSILAILYPKEVAAPEVVAKSDSLNLDSLYREIFAIGRVKLFRSDVQSVKAIADKEKAELERIEQDSLDAKLDRIGRARQAKRAEQYRKWAIRDSIYLAKEQERSDMRLRRKLARMAKRGIFIHMADSATLAKVDSTLLAEFGPLEVLVNKDLDSILAILYPKEVAAPEVVAKSDSLNLDSLYREIFAIGRVKLFRSDVQSVCDSLTTTSIDSIINLYKSPVMWSGSNQITAEKMHIYTSNNHLVKAVFDGKPLMAAEIDTAHYNQVAGKEMTALFRDNKIYRNDVNGNVQTIYYMQEDNSPEITLMAYIEAGDMTSYIENQEVVGITYRGNPVYTFYPMDKIPETQPTRLPDFKWEASRRPAQDSIFTRVVRPSRREAKRALRKPTFPINALLEQRKQDYLRRREWRDRNDVVSSETKEWIKTLR